MYISILSIICLVGCTTLSNEEQLENINSKNEINICKTEKDSINQNFEKNSIYAKQEALAEKLRFEREKEINDRENAQRIEKEQKKKHAEAMNTIFEKIENNYGKTNFGYEKPTFDYAKPTFR